MKLLYAAVFIAALFIAHAHAGAVEPLPANMADDDSLNIFCLRQAYPQITGITEDADGLWLEFANGRRAPYAVGKDNRDSSPRESMKQIYPLEPERPDTAPGFAPGRARPYTLFNALYGADEREVRAGLKTANLLGANISLAANAAAALKNALPRLEKLLLEKPELKKFLLPEGGFYWRKIAGENNLSAHAYGIALDVGLKASPYWRWSKVMPHPAQKTWPGEIVEIMEDNGFIWGGKWREYDLMHFEYRPELICKARLLAREKAEKNMARP